MITIRGASDDLIQVKGDVTAEFDCTDTGDGVFLAVSNGVVVRIRYRTCWRIDLVTSPGPDAIQIVPCPEDDEDNYSDVATIPGDVAWVVCREEFVRAVKSA